MNKKRPEIEDIPYDDTWDRSGEQKRTVFHKQIIADLNERKIPYIVSLHFKS